jgi:2,3-bisphosphoglycerate-dependent phosphoglycerate mutase
VLISAHGNSLRSIVMYLENLSKDEVVKLELATGEPLIYSYQNGRYDLP